MKNDKKRLEKEFKSFSKKMVGDNYIWFNALSTLRQLDLFYQWKQHKYYNRIEKVEIKKTKYGLIKLYPPSLKHFIKEERKNYKFIPDPKKVRNIKLEILLKNK